MSELLVFEQVTAGYGNAVVLDRLGFSLEAGESLAILGRNGVGKTTTLETLMGNTRVSAGAICWRGQDITSMPPHQRVRAGLGWVPQEREVFASLTVEETPSGGTSARADQTSALSTSLRKSSFPQLT